ncbi:unnamed protein product [marine sediment metagenome]|uniref:Uncharacterized protein n=1 Tax=marine sediment metagenome TaxID=412755 RepID=X1JLU0_9ZZZZ
MIIIDSTLKKGYKTKEPDPGDPFRRDQIPHVAISMELKKKVEEHFTRPSIQHPKTGTRVPVFK